MSKTARLRITRSLSKLDSRSTTKIDAGNAFVAAFGRLHIALEPLKAARMSKVRKWDGEGTFA
jgi:hypothetical protein